MFQEIIKLIIVLALITFAVWQTVLLIKDVRRRKVVKANKVKEVESSQSEE